MKQKYLLLLVLVLAVFTSCSKNDYLNVIPKDATLVASVNVANLAEKAELSGSSAVESVNKYIGLVFNGEAKSKIENYVSDPREIGVDFSSPIYMFATPSQCFCLTMRVGSKSKVDDFVNLLVEQGLCGKPVERDDMMTGTLLDEVEFAYDDNTFLFLYSYGDGGSAIRKQFVAQLFAQDKDDSFVSTEHFDIMDDDKKDMVMYSNLAGLPNETAMMYKQLLPNGVRISDVEMVASLTFEDGKAVYDVEMNGVTEKAKKTIEEWNKNFRKIEGRYIDSPSKDFLVWGCFGVEGNWFFEGLKNNSEFKQILYIVERAIDIEQIIRSIDGDLAFVIPSSFVTGESDNSVVDFIATAKVKKTKFLDDVDYWKRSMKDYGLSMRDCGKNQYVVSGNDMDMCWGVDGDDVYIATSDAFRRNIASQRSDLLGEYKDDILKSSGYIYVNLQSLPLMELAQLRGIPYASKLTNVKALIIKIESSRKGQIVFEMKDKKTNFLKQFFN